MTPDVVVARMRDIRDLDPVGFWPPAPGWGFVLVGLLAVAWLAYRYRWLLERRPGRPAWRHEALRELGTLENRIGHTTPKAIAAGLSELLRRIAVARCGRDECAGLEGERWLRWLSVNDRTAFAWTRYKRALIELPYAPPDADGGHELNGELRDLIAAARRWIRQDGPCRADLEQHDGI